MPEIEYIPVIIEIDVPDKVVGGTILKRKAKLFTMVYNQANKYLVLNWTITYYANDGGAYGEAMDAEGISSYTRESVADNTTKVEPESGAILVPDEQGNFAGPYMGQYDWFNMIAEGPVPVHNLIRQYGLGLTWN